MEMDRLTRKETDDFSIASQHVACTRTDHVQGNGETSGVERRALVGQLDV